MGQLALGDGRGLEPGKHGLQRAAVAGVLIDEPLELAYRGPHAGHHSFRSSARARGPEKGLDRGFAGHMLNDGDRISVADDLRNSPSEGVIDAQ